MELSHRNILKKSRQQIVDDLDVEDVMDSLIQHSVIDDENVERIRRESTTKARARRLLDILPSRGKKAYGVFLEALRTDYDWLADTLENGDRADRNNTQEINANLTKVLMRGGVPQHHNIIHRVEDMKTIKDALFDLNCGRYVVLHGMAGSGKSVLAAESLRDPQITVEKFGGGVFWLKVGRVDPDQLLKKIRALCLKLDPHTNLPNDLEEAQEILRNLFLSSEYYESLLVLDDVWSSEVVKTLNLPVRTLITTQDTSVMNAVPGTYTVIKIKAGFTEEESLHLLSSHLKVPLEYLPPEAKEIHRESKGSPMVMSMMASLLGESGSVQQTQRQSGRWSYYLTGLKNRRLCKERKLLQYEHENVMGAVQMSVDQLTKQHRSMYEKLAVFLDDDPIPSAALEVLWGVGRYEVEDIMNTFIQKSLAMSEFEPVQDCFVYSVHDLQLEYLKSRLTEEEDQLMHRRFVEKYFDRVHWIFGELPHDNYILTHLGYHLSKAGMDNHFRDIYLNLRYVEKVIKNCGTAAMLYDYRKYHVLITHGQIENEKDFEDFEEFCRTAGVLLSTYPSADIVQLGLAEPQESAVCREAAKLADQELHYFYLEWTNRSSLHSKNVATILHPGKPTDIKFFPDGRVVTSSEEGIIKIWNITTGEVMQRLHGHRKPVKCVSLEPGVGSDLHEVNLCTGGEDGAVKMWRSDPLPEEDHADNHNYSFRRKSVRKPSPKASLVTPFGELLKNNQDDSLNTIQVDGQPDDVEVSSVAWRPGSNQIAVAIRNGNILVYDGSGKEVFRISGHKETVNSLEYNASGRELASGSDDQTVRLWAADTGEFLASINFHEKRVIGLSWLGSAPRLATVSIEQLGIWETPGKGILVNPLQRNRPPSWNCVAASDLYVAAGTSADKMVILWSADSCQVVAALPGHCNHIIKLAFTEDSMYLSSISTDTMMVWEVSGLDSDHQLLSLGPVHHTRWIKNVPVTAAPDDRNRLTLLRQGRTESTSEPETSQVTALVLNKDCDMIVFGTESGHVKLFNTQTDSVTVLGRHDSTVLSIDITSDSIVVSGGLDCTVRIFYLDGSPVVCRGHPSLVRDVRIICNETRVLSMDSKGCLRVWDVRTGEEMNEVRRTETSHATCLDTWEGHGQSLVAVGGVTDGVNIVDLERGELKINIASKANEVRVAKFGPNGKLLVTGHDCGQVQEVPQLVNQRYNGATKTEIQVWDVLTGLPLTSPLSLHSSWVTDLALSGDCSTLVTAGDRLVWWSLKSLLNNQAPTPKRKLSFPTLRTRKTSESRSNRSSAHEDSLLSLSGPNSALASPLATPPSNRHLGFHIGSPSTNQYRPISLHPTSPLAPSNRKVPKVGQDYNQQILQNFIIKGNSVNKVFVNQDFNQFVTVDDAGILYILDEYTPPQTLFV